MWRKSVSHYFDWTAANEEFYICTRNDYDLGRYTTLRPVKTWKQALRTYKHWGKARGFYEQRALTILREFN